MLEARAVGGGGGLADGIDHVLPYTERGEEGGKKIILYYNIFFYITPLATYSPCIKIYLVTFLVLHVTARHPH